MGKSVLVTGYSKVPAKTSAADIYSVMGICMEIDVETGNILEADCTLVTDLSKEFVIELLKGEKITDISPLEEKFRRGYQGSAKKALVTAMKICHDRYLKALQNRKALEAETI
ncbi:DUF3870 domain-containing protein [uncultured Ilyobacter sp.]|uniref:DUF3870 domain-containing protein n=1 Tax=uncultured Ilyobacter sp. TaxID=544433 RepID=UPI0029F56235|nr:DUF3870 domain-containing protein [uncultured Ilyobacter sp.]